MTGQQAHVCRYLFAGLEQQNVTRHEIFRINFNRIAITQYTTSGRDELLQGGGSTLRGEFLDGADNGVD